VSVTSPPSLSKIIAEFVGPNNLGAYVRGGAFVPNTSTNAAVSTTSAGLKISQFVGATKYTSMTVTVANVSGDTLVGVSNGLIGTTTINVSAGQSPFTYSTVYKSGASFTITNATTNHPQFNRPGDPGAGTVSGTYTATVTDATGASVSKDFTVTDARS
jgi:hypothetical protein